MTLFFQTKINLLLSLHTYIAHSYCRHRQKEISDDSQIYYSFLIELFWSAVFPKNSILKLYLNFYRISYLSRAKCLLLKADLKFINTHYFPFISDYCYICCRLLLLQSSLHTPYTRSRALFMLRRIQVFHSPNHVTLDEKICWNAFWIKMIWRPLHW